MFYDFPKKDSNNRRSIIIKKDFGIEYKIGSNLIINGRSTTIVASSDNGVTVFDLFGEILSEDDMRAMLFENGISDIYNSKSLILRCCLLLIDLNNNIDITKTEYSYPKLSTITRLPNQTKTCSTTSTIDIREVKRDQHHIIKYTKDLMP